MIEQQNEVDSKSPNPRLVGDADIKRYAVDDAAVDGVDSIFQAFKARLIELAKIVTEDNAASTIKKFRGWADETNHKFVDMAGDIPNNLDIVVNPLESKTMNNLTAAKAKYKIKITQLGKGKLSWKQRFGSSLEENLEQPPQKNIYWLAGLILFLVAVESIANSRFFAEGSEFGLLGGTLTAITVSLGNVFIPLGLAFFGHRWFYRYDSYRFLGIAMIVLFILWALGFNHLVAQYRESLIAANQDSSTLNYVLLVALGVAVAGISFGKMWLFLDPYKQARKCLNDLTVAQEEFKDAVRADLIAAQNKYSGIVDDVERMRVGIPARFKLDEANFTWVHNKAIAATNAIFAGYHTQYCVAKVDPDPKKPVVTLENAERHGVGITDADRNFLAEMKTLLSDQIATATQEWIQKLHDMIRKINDLINKFSTVITHQLLSWEPSAEPA